MLFATEVNVFTSSQQVSDIFAWFLNKLREFLAIVYR